MGGGDHVCPSAQCPVSRATQQIGMDGELQQRHAHSCSQVSCCVITGRFQPPVSPGPPPQLERIWPSDLLESASGILWNLRQEGAGWSLIKMSCDGGRRAQHVRGRCCHVLAVSPHAHVVANPQTPARGSAWCDPHLPGVNSTLTELAKACVPQPVSPPFWEEYREGHHEL